MSVLQFFLLTLFFLNFYTSVLLTLTCRYVQATDKHDFVDKVSNLSLSGQYMFADYNPEGNMICKLGKSLIYFQFNFINFINVLLRVYQRCSSHPHNKVEITYEYNI